MTHWNSQLRLTWISLQNHTKQQFSIRPSSSSSSAWITKTSCVTGRPHNSSYGFTLNLFRPVSVASHIFPLVSSPWPRDCDTAPLVPVPDDTASQISSLNTHYTYCCSPLGHWTAGCAKAPDTASRHRGSGVKGLNLRLLSHRATHLRPRAPSLIPLSDWQLHWDFIIAVF